MNDHSLDDDVIGYLAKCAERGITATYHTYAGHLGWSVREFATNLAAVEGDTLKEAYEEYVRRMDGLMSLNELMHTAHKRAGSLGHKMGRFDIVNVYAINYCNVCGARVSVRTDKAPYIDGPAVKIPCPGPSQERMFED